MRRILGRISLRSRLALVYTIGMAALVIGAAGLLFVNVRNELSADLNTGLTARAEEISGALGSGSLPIRHREPFAQVIATNGRVLASSKTLEGDPSVLQPAELARAQHGRIYVDRPVPDLSKHARLLATPDHYRGNPVVVVVGGSRRVALRGTQRLGLLLLVATPTLIAVLAAGGFVLTRAALRPVRRMAATAETISVNEPGKRLRPPPGDDEIAYLARTLNAMLDRVEATFARERTFVDDASHELRTPVAILRAELELALAQPGTAEETEATLRSALEETIRLQRLADDLLVSARTAADSRQGTAEDVDVVELARLVADRLVAHNASIAVSVAGVHTLARVRPDDFERILTNLITNAQRFARTRSSVEVRRHGETVEVVVADDGPGFAPELLPVALDRFRRSDGHRANDGHGAGLGLAIVATLVDTNGGAISIANGPPLGGATVRVQLPRAQ